MCECFYVQCVLLLLCSTTSSASVVLTARILTDVNTTGVRTAAVQGIVSVD